MKEVETNKKTILYYKLKNSCKCPYCGSDDTQTVEEMDDLSGCSCWRGAVPCAYCESLNKWYCHECCENFLFEYNNLKERRYK